MCRVVDAPWKVPGVETSAFFNYSLTSAKWRAYIREIQQAHAESRMQVRYLHRAPQEIIRSDDGKYESQPSADLVLLNRQ